MARKPKSAKTSIWRSKRALAAVILLIIIAGGVAVALTHKSNTPSPAANPASSSNGNVNYNPPTTQDKKDVQANKNALSQSDQGSSLPTDSSGKKSVTPVITSADETQVTAYVPGIFEDGGTCIAVFSKGSQTLSKNVTAFANATYTSCPPINVSASFFPSAGQWAVTVAYKSSTAEGTSAPSYFEVQ